MKMNFVTSEKIIMEYVIIQVCIVSAIALYQCLVFLIFFMVVIEEMGGGSGWLVRPF